MQSYPSSCDIELAHGIYQKVAATNTMISTIYCLHSAHAGQQQPVTEICLGCICEAISGCNQTLTCGGDVCGLFRITWAYWADAGKPTVGGESSDAQTAYGNCANQPACAARTVQGYMARFGQVNIYSL